MPDLTPTSQEDLAHAFAASLGGMIGWLVSPGVVPALRVILTGRSLILEVGIPRVELGKAVGKNGRIAQAIRTVAFAAGAQHFPDRRLSIDFVEKENIHVDR